MNIQNIEKIRNKIIPFGNCDGLLVTNERNIVYIIGILIEGYVYIDNKCTYIITDNRYTEEVKKIIEKCDDVVCINIINNQEVINLLENKCILVESKDMTLYKSRLIKEKYNIKNIIESEDFIEEIRMIKNEEEISNIKKACEIADKAFSSIIDYIKVGMSEFEIRDELERQMKLNGAQGLSFETIVASGSNSSKPHAICTDRKIQNKDIILFDFGCKYNGYCSDMSRTIFVGNPNEKQIMIYNIVKEVQQEIINMIKPGAKCSDLDLFVHDKFRKCKIEENYLHSLGHGVGLDIHELPYLSTKSKNVLDENMIITDEPGIYFENEFGIRIEDTICVGKDGAIKLTNTDKNIIII